MEKSLQSRDTIRTKKIFSFLSAGGKSEEKLLRNPFCVKKFKNVRECSMLPEEEVPQQSESGGQTHFHQTHFNCNFTLLENLLQNTFTYIFVSGLMQFTIF